MPAPVYLTINEFPGTGAPAPTVVDFNFAGGYISPAHVKAELFDPVTYLRTPITVTDDEFVSDFRLSLPVVVPVGRILRVYRDTPKNQPLVNFTNGSRIAENNLDLVAQQAVFVAAEAADQLAILQVADVLEATEAAADSAEAAQIAAAASAASASAGATASAASAASAATAAASAESAASAASASASAAAASNGALSAALAGTGGAGLVGSNDGDTVQGFIDGLKLTGPYVLDAAGDTVTDDTAAQQAAVIAVQNTYDPALYASNSPANGSGRLLYKAGFYRTQGTITVTKKVAFQGDGPAEFSSGSRVVQYTPASDLFRIEPIAQGMSVSFENMTLRGVGSGGGSLINVTRTAATCNSQRYYGMVFATPPRFALKIDAGNDIIIDNALFDVAAGSAMSLGTALSTAGVSDVRLTNAAFFSIATRCIEAYHIDGMQITAAQVFPANSSGRTQYVIDGFNTLPYLLKDISIIGGNFKNVDCLAHMQAVNKFTVSGVTVDGFGAGGSATLDGLRFQGTCSGVSITGNTFKGNFGTRSFFSDFGATITGANITGNTFINTGGTGPALICADTAGVIANNTFVGFTTPSVSEMVTTTGLSVSPGSIAAGGVFNFDRTVSGARQGDRVEFGVVDLVWPVPVGVEVQAFISAPGTVRIQYRNVTASAIVVAAHDVRFCVSRGT